jgi:hypothetical protein
MNKFSFGNNDVDMFLVEQEAVNQGALRFDKNKVTIERHQRSTTQGHVKLYYDGDIVGEEGFGDEIKLVDGEYEGRNDEYWSDAVKYFYYKGHLMANITPLIWNEKYKMTQETANPAKIDPLLHRFLTAIPNAVAIADPSNADHVSSILLPNKGVLSVLELHGAPLDYVSSPDAVLVFTRKDMVERINDLKGAIKDNDLSSAKLSGSTGLTVLTPTIFGDDSIDGELIEIQRYGGATLELFIKHTPDSIRADIPAADLYNVFFGDKTTELPSVEDSETSLLDSLDDDDEIFDESLFPYYKKIGLPVEAVAIMAEINNEQKLNSEQRMK